VYRERERKREKERKKQREKLFFFGKSEKMNSKFK
jgi:hypothetical protein